MVVIRKLQYNLDIENFITGLNIGTEYTELKHATGQWPVSVVPPHTRACIPTHTHTHTQTLTDHELTVEFVYSISIRQFAT